MNIYQADQKQNAKDKKSLLREVGLVFNETNTK